MGFSASQDGQHGVLSFEPTCSCRTVSHSTILHWMLPYKKKKKNSNPCVVAWTHPKAYHQRRTGERTSVNLGCASKRVEEGTQERNKGL